MDDGFSGSRCSAPCVRPGPGCSGSWVGCDGKRCLSALLVHVGEAVSRDELVGASGDRIRPRPLSSAIHGYIARLREVLEPERTARTAGPVVALEGGSYRLKAADRRVDLHAARANATSARRAHAAGRLASWPVSRHRRRPASVVGVLMPFRCYIQPGLVYRLHCRRCPFSATRHFSW